MALREMRMNPAFLRDGRCAANGWSDCHFCCVGEEVLQGQLVFFDNWGLLTTKISFLNWATEAYSGPILWALCTLSSQ